MLLAIICLCKWRGASCNRWASGGVEWVLPCCSRLLCNCIAKAKIENSVDLCMTVHFPPPFSYFPAVGLRVLNPAVKETTQECSAKLTICSKHWLVHEILACAWGKLWGTSVVYWVFFRTAGTERTCPGTRVHQKNGCDFLLYFPAEQEPVISPCLSTAGHELTKICMCRVCSVSVRLRKGLDLCALKI